MLLDQEDFWEEDWETVYRNWEVFLRPRMI